MKIVLLGSSICLLGALPAQGAKSRSESAAVQTDDTNRQFAEKLYQFINSVDQNGRNDAKIESVLAAQKQQLADHQMRIELIESYEIRDDKDIVPLAQLQAEFHAYQKNESARLMIASAFGACIAAGVGGIIYWFRK